MINNRLCSDYFNLTRDGRQSDPLFLYLFLLAVENLAIVIRVNEQIKWNDEMVVGIPGRKCCCQWLALNSWNNQDIRIDNKPCFRMKYYDIGIWNVRDLRFDLNNMESYELIAKDVKKKETNFLGWISMRHSIAPKLKSFNCYDHTIINPYCLPVL